MDVKSYVRRGSIFESISYEEVISYCEESPPPEHIIAVLEGKGRRKVRLTPKRWLYENYFEGSFIGIEDFLLENSRKGAAGVFPGTHYVLWDGEDFLNAIRLNPPLMWRAVDSLSKRIRIYDQKQRHISQDLQSFKDSMGEEVGHDASSDILNSLYKLTFSEDDQFPEEILEKLAVSFKEGDYVIQQGDKTRDIYIILSGQAKIVQRNERVSEEIDIATQGSFVGEMSMFDTLPRSADVIAINDLLTLKFDISNFHLLFRLHSRWAMKILISLAQRVEQRRGELEKYPLSSLSQVQELKLDL